jgi:phosphoglycolate phosphatase-like HAD superfamily hydrolase
VLNHHKPLLLELDGAIGDTRPLWRDWLRDASRVLEIDPAQLPADRSEAAERLDRSATGNWRVLLERYAEDRATIYLRPAADVSAALRRLSAAGVRLGIFTDAPEELARIAVAQLGATRRVEAVEAGAAALERLRTRLGGDCEVVATRARLLELAP